MEPTATPQPSMPENKLQSPHNRLLIFLSSARPPPPPPLHQAGWGNLGMPDIHLVYY